MNDSQACPVLSRFHGSTPAGAHHSRATARFFASAKSISPEDPQFHSAWWGRILLSWSALALLGGTRPSCGADIVLRGNLVRTGTILWVFSAELLDGGCGPSPVIPGSASWSRSELISGSVGETSTIFYFYFLVPGHSF